MAFLSSPPQKRTALDSSWRLAWFVLLVGAATPFLFPLPLLSQAPVQSPAVSPAAQAALAAARKFPRLPMAVPSDHLERAFLDRFASASSNVARMAAGPADLEVGRQARELGIAKDQMAIVMREATQFSSQVTQMEASARSMAATTPAQAAMALGRERSMVVRAAMDRLHKALDGKTRNRIRAYIYTSGDIPSRPLGPGK